MPDSILDLTDRVAIVTGGGTGIGRAIAHVFADHGARVVLASRKVENLERVASELQEAGHTALVVPTDVRERAAVEAMVERTVDEYGRVDVLVNNAGGNHRVAAAEVTDSIWDRMVNLNLRGPFLCSQAVFPVMSKQGGGVIVNISSEAANSGAREFMPYGSAKAGLQQMTRMLAAEWAEHGIRVNCVAAGLTKTEGFIRGRKLAGLDPDANVGSNAMRPRGTAGGDRLSGAVSGLRRGVGPGRPSRSAAALGRGRGAAPCGRPRALLSNLPQRGRGLRGAVATRRRPFMTG